MSRLYAITGTADGQAGTILSAIPFIDVVKEPYHVHKHLHITHQGIINDLIVLPVRPTDVNGDLLGPVSLSESSNAPSNLWDLFLLVADSGSNPNANWRWIARAQRWLIKRRQEDPGWVAGPWSIGHFAELFPTIADDHLKDAQGNWNFPILAGDVHEQILEWRYEPNQDAVDNDTEPSKEEIAPAPPEEP